MDLQEVSSRILQSRKKLGLSQQQLAEKVGVTSKAVSKWERGVNLPDISLLVPLSRVLGVSVQELLDISPEDLSSKYSNSLSLNQRTPDRVETERISDQILIDLSDAREFSPYVFGHNLEHTRACMAGGLSAQMLRNRKFAGKPSKNQGCPADWFAIGDTDVFFALEQQWGGSVSPEQHVVEQWAGFVIPEQFEEEQPYTQHKSTSKMPRKNEIQTLVVQNLYGTSPCGFGQDNLFLKAGKNYELRIAARGPVSTELTVKLTDRTGDQIYAQNSIRIDSEVWKLYEFMLTPDREDTEGCLRITFTRKTKVFFGAVSMLPEGHFLGLRRDVVENLKQIGASLLRWPGGNFAGEYRWQDGLLPVDMRAPLQSYTEIETQPYTHGYDFHEMGTDEFIALCREVGAEPFITINPVWNTPEENAAWVEYCNGSTDTPYGALRAQRGHPEPYNVKFWSLGNEMGYPHMEGPITPEHYASIANLHASRMLEKDPELNLFSSGPYPNEDWANKAAKILADKAKYVSLHNYSRTQMDFSSPEAIEESCRQIFSAPYWNLEIIHKMRQCLGEGIHISFDEWNCWYTWFRPSSVAEGIYTAEMLHLLLQESLNSDMPVCCYFQPVGEGAIQVAPGESKLTANGQAFAMMSSHRGGKLCRISSVDSLAAVASIREDVLTVTLVNTNLHTPRTFAIGTVGKVICAEVLRSQSILPHSRFESEPLETLIEDGTITTTLPAHSVAKLCVQIKP